MNFTLNEFRKFMKNIRIIEENGKIRKINRIDENLSGSFNIYLKKTIINKTPSIRQAEAMENIVDLFEKFIENQKDKK